MIADIHFLYIKNFSFDENYNDKLGPHLWSEIRSPSEKVILGHHLLNKIRLTLQKGRWSQSWHHLLNEIRLTLEKGSWSQTECRTHVKLFNPVSFCIMLHVSVPNEKPIIQYLSFCGLVLRTCNRPLFIYFFVLFNNGNFGDLYSLLYDLSFVEGRVVAYFTWYSIWWTEVNRKIKSEFQQLECKLLIVHF